MSKDGLWDNGPSTAWRTALDTYSVLKLLQSPAGRPALTRGTASTDSQVRRESFRLVLDANSGAPDRKLLTSLANARQIQGALLGLAERGVEDDVLLILPWLTDPRARLRAAALQATAMLDPTSIEPFIDALCDPSKRISRAAAKVIARRPRHDLVARLSSIVESAAVAPHVRAHARDLICAASPWTRLLALLRITASACQAAAEQAAQRIRPHTSQRPTADDLRAVDEALAAASLTIATRFEIVYSLRFWHE